MANTDYLTPLNLNAAGNVVVPAVQANVDIVRGCHWGDSVPNLLVSGMLWAQPSTGVLWMRNAANDGWVAVGALTTPVLCRATISALSATTTTLLMTHKASFVVQKLRLTSVNATTGSDGSNNWAWQLTNATDSLNLFATAPTTNGAELAAYTPTELAPDQNLTVPADKVLRFGATLTGSATTITELLVEVTGYLRGT